jgi:hypothetical protein
MVEAAEEAAVAVTVAAVIILEYNTLGICIGLEFQSFLCACILLVLNYSRATIRWIGRATISHIYAKLATTSI